jgi:hypothetical protein
MSVMEQAGTYDIFKQRVAKSRNPTEVAKIKGDNAAFEASALGRKQFGEAAKLEAELNAGKKREALAAELPAAEAELIAEGLGTDNGFGAGNFFRKAMSGFTVEGKDVRIQQRAIERLKGRAMTAFQKAQPGKLFPQSEEEILAGVNVGEAAGYAELAATGESAKVAQYYQTMIEQNNRLIEQNALILKEAQKNNTGKDKPLVPAPAAQRVPGPAGAMRRPNAGS